MVKKNLILILCASLTTASLYSMDQLRGISIFSPRSQDRNAARDIVDWHRYIHRWNAEKNYSVLSFTPQYNQSLRPERIDLALFNSDTFSLSGSQIPLMNLYRIWALVLKLNLKVLMTETPINLLTLPWGRQACG